MIAVSNRFHGNNSLNYVYRNGRTIRSKYFSIKYATNDRRKTYRLAVVISRNVAKNAVTRNRIRRRLYELFRTEVAAKLSNLDVVINVYDAEVADLTPTDLRQVFLQATEQMHF